MTTDQLAGCLFTDHPTADCVRWDWHCAMCSTIAHKHWNVAYYQITGAHSDLVTHQSGYFSTGGQWNCEIKQMARKVFDFSSNLRRNPHCTGRQGSLTAGVSSTTYCHAHWFWYIGKCVKICWNVVNCHPTLSMAEGGTRTWVESRENIRESGSKGDFQV